MKLPDSQVAVLSAASATDPKPIAQLAEETDYKPETVTGAAFDLRDEGLVAVSERERVTHEVTDEGSAYLDEGLPEVRLYRAAVDAGGTEEPVDLGRAIGEAGLDGPQVDIALANFARKGYGEVEAGTVRADPDADPESDPERRELEALAAGEDVADEAALSELVRRGLVERHERTERSVTLTDAGVTALMEGVEAAETVDRLTPELLASGEWREVEFADYNVEADAPEYRGGRTHILRQTADRVKDVLVGMGFREMEGPHADAQFWINDCLFMPQDHPARTHWDQFELDLPPMEGLPEDLMERVRSAHLEGVGEDGDGYHSPWTEEVARQVDLRGHTTSLSM
ncbi:MAG: phenylalanine--tRNA ligase subunit alpha, partial [Haloferacaceae archaeon]